MLTKLFTIGVINTQAGQINQVQGFSVNPNFEVLQHFGDGVVDPRWSGVMFQQPLVSFTTTAIVRALTAAGISGLAITGAVDVYFQKMAAGGTRQTGANSTKATASKGILCPRTLEVNDRGFATIRYDFAAISSDGTTVPLTYTTGVTMPAATDVDQLFTVGPVSINGSAVEGIKRTTIDFGLSLAIESGDGEGFPTFAAILRRTPTITCRTKNVDVANQISGMVAAQGTTDSVVYLRKCAEGGTRVANATAEHVSFTVDDGMITVQEVAGEDGDTGEGEVLISPVSDGTNDIVAVNLATAIA